MGPDYVLLRFDAMIPVDDLLSAAAKARVPITLLDVTFPELPVPYKHT